MNILCTFHISVSWVCYTRSGQCPTHRRTWSTLIWFLSLKVLLTCDHLNSQPKISTHHLPYPLSVDLDPVCWTPPITGAIFYHLIPFFDFLVPLKNTQARHGVICMYLLKHSNGHFNGPKTCPLFVAQYTSFIPKVNWKSIQTEIIFNNTEINNEYNFNFLQILLNLQKIKAPLGGVSSWCNG